MNATIVPAVAAEQERRASVTATKREQLRL
jgi:hypothetical protein